MRYIEELKIGGGYGSSALGLSPAGGMDLDNNGDLSIDGDLVVDGTADVMGALTTNGNLIVDRDSDAATAQILITGDAGESRQMSLQTGGVNRFKIEGSTDAEAGANAGTNLLITRHNDAGTKLDNALEIERATGDVTITNDLGVSGGVLSSGVSGTTRGTLLGYRGGGGNTPGYLLLESADGTDIYLHVAADGTLRHGTGAPTGDTSGDPVGGLTAYGQMGFENTATPVTVTINTAGVWEQLTLFEASISRSDGTYVTETIGADDYLTVGTGGAGEYLIRVECSCTPASGTNKAVSVGYSIDGTDPAKGGRVLRTLSSGAYGNFGISDIIALSATDVIRMEVKNDTDTNNVTFNSAKVTMYRLGD